MHQDVQTPARTVRITGDVKTLQRMPAHWADRRAGLHARIDVLLEDWERAPDPRANGHVG